MIRAGLTGSIAMGKSEVARICRDMGFSVHDADAAVHALYASERGKAALRSHFPHAVTDEGIDRARLSAIVTADPEKLKLLESIVHPLLRDAEQAFLRKAESDGAALAILDIPLLFETRRDREMDVTIVVSAPAAIQRQRALQRPGMSEGKLAAILARQMPDAEKRSRADFVIENTGTLEDLATRTREVLQRILAKPQPPRQGPAA